MKLTITIEDEDVLLEREWNINPNNLIAPDIDVQELVEEAALNF